MKYTEDNNKSYLGKFMERLVYNHSMVIDVNTKIYDRR